MSTSGVEIEADSLLTGLTAGLNFNMPVVNLSDPLFNLPISLSDALYGAIHTVTTDDITTRSVGGTGTFDGLMEGVSNHLKREFEKGRITGNEYTQAYIALTQAALTSSVQFVLNKDQAFWAAQNAQIAAISARVELEKLKIELAKAQYEALLMKTTYATQKIKLASEEMAFTKAKIEAEQIMPEQVLASQTARQIQQFQLTQIMPSQAVLAREQANTAFAQTGDYRGDGALVVGVLGKQKELYAQQIRSYQQDGQVKAAKLFTDAWITMKTMDEGLAPPGNFTNVILDKVLDDVRIKNELV